jgi:hypothetical protein
LEELVVRNSINGTSCENSVHKNEEPRLPIEHPMDEDLGDATNPIGTVSDVLAAAKGMPVWQPKEKWRVRASTKK